MRVRDQEGTDKDQKEKTCSQITEPGGPLGRFSQTVVISFAVRTHCKFKQENQSKASEWHQTLLNSRRWKWQRKTRAHEKLAKQQM